METKGQQLTHSAVRERCDMPPIHIDMVTFQTSYYTQHKLLSLCKWIRLIHRYLIRPTDQTVQQQFYS
jgi:hypothetical protein